MIQYTVYTTYTIYDTIYSIYNVYNMIQNMQLKNVLKYKFVMLNRWKRNHSRDVKPVRGLLSVRIAKRTDSNKPTFWKFWAIRVRYPSGCRGHSCIWIGRRCLLAGAISLFPTHKEARKREWTRTDTGPKPVADGWAGAEMWIFTLFDLCWRTDGRMEGQTDTGSYRVACPQLKILKHWIRWLKAGYTANTSCRQVGRGGNARFHIFQLNHYRQTNGQTDRRKDKASNRVVCLQLKTISYRINNFEAPFSCCTRSWCVKRRTFWRGHARSAHDAIPNDLECNWEIPDYWGMGINRDTKIM